MEFLVLWLIFSALVGVLGSTWGRSGFLWFLIALVLSPLLGVIILLIAGRANKGDSKPTPKTHVTCPDCAELVRKEAKVCKHCGARLKPELAALEPRPKSMLNTPGFKAAVIVAVVVLGGVYLVGGGVESSSEGKRLTSAERAEAQKERERLAYVAKLEKQEQRERERREKDCRNTISAFIMSQSFVKQALRSPSTAKFPHFAEQGVSSVAIGDCKFRVTAHVDAQNGFGAMIRSKYTVDLEYLPDSQRWLASNLQM